MPAIPTCKSNVHPITVLQPVFEVWHETAEHNVKRIAVVVACLPDFAAYVIGGGQGWTAAFVLLDVVIITAGKMPNLDRGRQTCSPSHIYKLAGA